MSRRFPEATVLESYRLFELSSCGRIPNSKCFDIPDENEVDASEESSSGSLDSDEMKALDSLYQKIDRVWYSGFNG